MTSTTGKRGGTRPGAGRPRGQVSKARQELSEAARAHTKAALDTLVRIMQDTEQSAAARVTAACAILDRGYGKPRQAVEHGGPDGDGPIIIQLDEVDLRA